ncbi:protein of unknown function [Candidatus Promineifilum breve]|uniref:Uncharacterized protein n=1 Tax=Candidatus Promineifilum breve TaxID=1806508 RepID=A0A161KAJ7_9CHLR|nr:protein of unknown function [Candidatus Promineifilum breve]
MGKGAVTNSLIEWNNQPMALGTHAVTLSRSLA